jgi:argininosuccinate lyase
MKIKKLWGGRFETLPSQETIDFLSGRDVKAMPPCDERLIPYDLWGSRAHVLMLCRQGILSSKDSRKILKGLREIEALHRAGNFHLDPAEEDVHSNIESFLIRRAGIESGGKIHTGRSRNDQICLDMRLYLRDQVLDFVGGVAALIDVLLQRAEAHRSALMPGYTHHHHATVTTFGHLLSSFAEALERDAQRLFRWFELFNKNPLGAAAGYGTSFKLDRPLTSRLLGFDGPTENVTDPITQRWEPEVELAFAVAVTMNHLSTMAQTLILLSTSEFHMVKLDDRHCSGSSMMPQKRNPCSLEVIKAKAAFAHGMLVSLLSVGKALFMGYNRDTQWTKYWIMDLIDESKPALSVMRDVVRLLRIDKGHMLEQAEREFLGATALMEWLVHFCALPLRKAKMVVEKAVRYAEKEGLEKVSSQHLEKALREMKIKVQVSAMEIEKIQMPEAMRSQLVAIGAPSERKLKENILSLKKRLKTHREWYLSKQRQLDKAKGLLSQMEKQLTN